MTGELVATVEHKIRDDFSQTQQPRVWIFVNAAGQQVPGPGAGMTVDWSSTASALIINSGTTPNSETILRYNDPLESPVRVMFAALAAQMLSTRIANCEVELRLRSGDGGDYVSWLFDGTTATGAKMRSANQGVGVADTAVTGLPDTGTGSPMFELEAWIDEVYWQARVADSTAGRTASFVRNRRVPDPNNRLYVELVVRNGATAPASSTALRLDSITIQDISELTAEVTGGRGGGAASQALPVTILGTPTVNLGTASTGASSLAKAEDAAHGSGDVGIQVLGVRQAATPAALTSTVGDYSPVLVDAEGKVVTVGQADPVNTFQVVVTATAAGSTALRGSAGAGLRSYVTDLVISNSSATGTKVSILDGTTTIWSAWLAPGAAIDKVFGTPLRGSAATGLNVSLSAAVTDVTVSASGYNGI